MNPARCLAAWWRLHRHGVNVLHYGSTAVPWRPTAPRPTLGAAVLRLTEGERDAP